MTASRHHGASAASATCTTSPGAVRFWTSDSVVSWVTPPMLPYAAPVTKTRSRPRWRGSAPGEGVQRGGRRGVVGVDQHVRRPQEVVAHLLGLLLGQLEGVERGEHVPHPAVAHVDGHGIGGVPHPQPGVAALLAVGGRAAEVLGEEHPQPALRGGEVGLGVERPQRRVARDAFVEGVHQGLERRCAADLVVEAHAGPATGPPKGPSGGALTSAASSAALSRSRISRCTGNCSPGTHWATVRIVIVIPTIDSTPSTFGSSTNLSAHSGSAPMVLTVSRMTPTTRSTLSE